MVNGCDRREPAVDVLATEAPELDSRPASEDREGEATARGPASQTSDDASHQPEKAQRAGGGSFLRKMVYAGLVLCLGGLIALGGGVAYYASQLPPLNQLTVPSIYRR